MAVKKIICILILLLVNACSHETANPELITTQTKKDAIETSLVKWCGLDVGKAEVLANQGNLNAIRNLRGYYIDCVHGDNSSLIKWAMLAAQLGENVDQKAYMQILTMPRFYSSKGSEWESPICGEFRTAPKEKLASEGNLIALHQLLAYYIECENAGVSQNIFRTAKKASIVGDKQDVEFYRNLVEIAEKRSGSSSATHIGCEDEVIVQIFPERVDQLPKLEEEALTGSTSAALGLAHWYFLGRDDAKREYWTRIAAENGSTSGKHNLGMIYAAKEPTKLNRIRARFWLKQAIKCGSPHSELQLEDMDKQDETNGM